MAQPAVSSQLRSLEKWLGTPLFFRSGNERHLTEAGQRMFELAQEVLSRVFEVKRDIEGLADGTGGAAIVAASMAVGTYLLTPPMTDFATARPESEVTLRIAEPQVAMHEAEVGAVDFAVLTSARREAPSHFREAGVHDEPMVLFASPDGPPDSDEVTLEEAAGLPHVRPPLNVEPQLNLERQLRARGVALSNVVVRLGHAEAIKRTARDHQCVSFLPRYTIEEELASGELREVRVVDAELVDHIVVLVRQNKRLSKLQDDCLEHILEYLAARGPLMELASSAP